MTIDLSKIPHLEERRKIMALREQRDEIESEQNDASAEARAALNAEQSRIWARHREEEKTLLTPLRKAVENLEEPFNGRLEVIDAEIEAICEPLESAPDYHDDYCGIHMCALTELILLDGDEVITDEETGERILRAALPFPDQAEAA